MPPSNIPGSTSNPLAAKAEDPPEKVSTTFLMLLGMPKLVKILVDNQSVLDLTNNLKHHDRMKYVDVRHHFVR